MPYNFDTPINRRNTDSVKWNVESQELPMWIADMDFQTAPEILDAINARAAHGVFGYPDIPDAWYEAYIGWWKRRYHFTMEKEWLSFSISVVPALSSVVRKITEKDDNVLICTPVYNHFFNAIGDNGRHVLTSPLLYDGISYRIDFSDLEKKLADPKTTLMILCNPHNPIGKIWERETLAEIGRLCYENHVVVLSDEIHCDLSAPGRAYIPFASVSELCKNNSITCIAPTKTFNIAGLQTAAVSVPNPVLRKQVADALRTDEINGANVFAITAAIAAYNQGEAWLDALRVYLQKNREYVANFLQTNLPQLHLVPSEATYLLWIDCSAVDTNGEDAAAYIRKKTGLFLADGKIYGEEGKSFVRMNIACPKATVQEGLLRLQKAFSPDSQQ